MNARIQSLHSKDQGRWRGIEIRYETCESSACSMTYIERAHSRKVSLKSTLSTYLQKKELVNRRVLVAVQDVSPAELDSKRWRISPPRRIRVFGVYTCSFNEGSLNAYKQAVVRFPLSFTRHLCAPDRRSLSR